MYLIFKNYVCISDDTLSLTAKIQNAVCNTGIKIEDQLYNLFWGNGEWCVAQLSVLALG